MTKTLDPKTDTVCCERCRRTVRRSMTQGRVIEGMVSDVRRVCGGLLSASCARLSKEKRSAPPATGTDE